mmetsp:Transcript_20752/g.59274  ORF Transcript_20752/g.59274 Transcript_20752/m.59274 type:complete len:246 (+) Transcript_20752:813-1550(+)
MAEVSRGVVFHHAQAAVQSFLDLLHAVIHLPVAIAPQRLDAFLRSVHALPQVVGLGLDLQSRVLLECVELAIGLLRESLQPAVQGVPEIVEVACSRRLANFLDRRELLACCGHEILQLLGMLSYLQFEIAVDGLKLLPGVRAASLDRRERVQNIGGLHLAASESPIQGLEAPASNQLQLFQVGVDNVDFGFDPMINLAVGLIKTFGDRLALVHASLNLACHFFHGVRRSLLGLARRLQSMNSLGC